LWPETLEAVTAVRRDRPAPLDPADADCLFLTAFGRRWVRYNDRGDDERGVRIDAVGLEFKKLVKKAGVPPCGFYWLRHAFQTVADGTRDKVAVTAVMGHVDESMAGVYRELIEDGRIEAVVNHVRLWLLAGKRPG
jgi:integrase